jgi:hypothetical protein
MSDLVEHNCEPVRECHKAVAMCESSDIQFMETIDNVGDFCRFVDRSNRSELSFRDIAEIKRVRGAIIESLLTFRVAINLLKAIWRSWLRTEREVIRRGKAVSLMKCDIIDEPVAQTSSRQLAQVALAKTDELKLDHPTEHREREWRQRGSQLLSEQIDADERLPGHLREPHLPRFESRRARNFADSLGIADRSESSSLACPALCCASVTLNYRRQL